MRHLVCTGIAYILLSSIALVSALDWNFTPQGQSTPCIKVSWDVTKMDLIETLPSSGEGDKKAIVPSSGTVDASSQCGSLLKLNFENDVSMSLNFLQSNNMVTMDGILTFVPFKVFGKPESQNTTATLLMDGNLALSANDKSFTCNSPITLTFTNATASDNYKLDVEVANTQIQAVGITNGDFSEGVPCQADVSNGTVTTEAATTVGPNSNVTTQPPTTANATTEKPTTEKPTSEKPTTEAPTTAPPSTGSKYYYPNATDPCVIVAGDFKLDVTYDKKDNSTGNVVVMVPAEVTAGGSCPPASEISMTWGTANAMRMVRMKFTTNNDQVEISTISAEVDLDSTTFPDAKDANMTIDFPANMLLSKSTGYYKCKATVDVSLSDSIKLVMEDVAIQAYNVKGSDFSGERDECAADSPTTVAPVTTPAPVTPAPGSPPTNDYTFPGHCIVLDAGLEFVIPYTMSDDKNSSVTVGIPSNFTTTGTCGNVTQMLKVTFYDNWSMEMYFSDGGSATMLSDTDSFFLKEMKLTYFLQTDIFKDPKINPNTPQVVNSTFGSSQFSAKKTGSYECNSKVNLGLSNGVTMNSNNLRVKAFSTDNSTGFPSDDLSECPQDSDTNSVVPIAVGAALAGLVIIVLIAYLIGRRRSRSGYQQV